MKIPEDREVKIQNPSLFVGSYQGAEALPNPNDFKLSSVEEQLSPPKLKLIFSTNGQSRTAWIEAVDGSVLGSSHLLTYKKEIQEKLIGSSSEEILTYDFTFDKASRLQ